MSRTKLLEGNLSPEEKIIAEYIEENASEVLVEKINRGNKGIKDCWKFIYEQARECAKGENAIMVEDKQVFGWAIHYFEEDSLPVIKVHETAKPKETKAAAPKVEKKPVPKKQEPKKDNNELLPGQMTIFDFMGGTQ